MDARLGDDGDFETFLHEAHQRGLKVLLDGVFNHVGRGFAPLARVLSGDSTDESMFVRTSAPGEPAEFANFEGHDALVALNHAEPAVVELVTEVMLHWLERGIDGWRLDAAYAVPTTFWATVLGRVRQAYPNAYIFAEVLHGDYAAFVTESGVDSVTQYELWKAIWSAINEGNFFELEWAMTRHNEFLETFTPVTFLGNHDVTRVASAIADPRHVAHAAVVLLTLGGTPTIYYGDEQGFTGVKEERVGGDDAVRPEFPALPADLPADGWSMYHLLQELIGLRRRHAWLHTAHSRTLALTNTFFAYEVSDGSAERLVVALNLGESPEQSPEVPTEVLAGAATHQVPAHAWAIFR